jgi:NAD(P)-dependent dehydrogenase (short-subunit alcohol dehydrogenase family)
MTETVYFITGASRGIGLEFIKQLVNRDNTIIYAGVRNPSSLQKTFSFTPGNLHIVQCDVTSDDSVAMAAEYVSHNSGRVDVLINNAGIEDGLSIRQGTIESFRSVIETNLIGVHRMTKTFLPLLRSSTIKKVINISSDFGSVELNDRTFCAAYNVSKAALNMLTVQYKNEFLDDGIIFIPMHPGDVAFL